MHHVSSLCRAWLTSCKPWVGQGVRGYTQGQATVEAESHSNNNKRLARNVKLSDWTRGAVTPDVKKSTCPGQLVSRTRAVQVARASPLQRISAPRNPKPSSHASITATLTQSWYQRQARAGHTKHKSTTEAEQHSNNRRRLTSSLKLRAWSAGSPQPTRKMSSALRNGSRIRAAIEPRAATRQ